MALENLRAYRACYIQPMPILQSSSSLSSLPRISCVVTRKWRCWKMGQCQPTRTGEKNFLQFPRAAAAAVDIEPQNTSTSNSNILLEVKGLTAVVAESRQEILKGIDLIIRQGEVHAIMGKNGSGKSTFSKVLVGHPDYEVTGGTVIFKGENLLDKEPEVRCHAGLFMSFQSPVEIPGVSNMDFLRMACNARRSSLGLTELGPLEFYGFLSPKLTMLNMDPKFLDRNVNEGFSGGEKKRNEILQLAREWQGHISVPVGRVLESQTEKFATSHLGWSVGDFDLLAGILIKISAFPRRLAVTGVLCAVSENGRHR